MARSKPPIKQSTYDKEVTEEILERISKGETLKAICRDLEWPPSSTFRHWVLQDHDNLMARYDSARQLQAESWQDDLMDEASDEAKETQRSRLIVDTKKWLMAKMHPRVYGDKVENTVVGKDGGPLVMQWQPPAKE